MAFLRVLRNGRGEGGRVRGGGGGGGLQKRAKILTKLVTERLKFEFRHNLHKHAFENIFCYRNTINPPLKKK